MSDMVVQEQVQEQAQEQVQAAPAQVRLVDIQITSKQDAFQLIIHFLNLANKRGAFSMDESHKIWECVKMFSSPTGSV